MDMADRLFLLAGARRDDPGVAAWFDQADPVRQMAAPWFERLLACGAEVGAVMHDGAPTACVAGAAFAYVSAHARHANIGFFHGNALADPAGLLLGAGKHMRHIRLGWGAAVDEPAITRLIDAAYADIVARLGADRQPIR